MIVLGIILLVLGYTIAPPPVATIGWVLVLVGVVLLLVHSVGGYGSVLY
jgi:hypothetical protein